MMDEYVTVLRAYDGGEVTAVPALVFFAQDSDKLVMAPLGTVIDSIAMLEINRQPDDVAILEFKGNGKVYKFEFPPGPPAEDALRLLKWFRDAMVAAGPLTLA